MRKTLFLTAFIVCTVAMSSEAQYVDIPDSLFRSFLLYRYPGCMNAAGQLDTTCSEILSVEELEVNSVALVCDYTYQDLTGLQYFKNLRKLNISNNPCLETFPVIHSLKELYASFTRALKLSSLPNGLKIFDVSLPDNSRTSYVYPNLPFINDNGHLPDSLEYLNSRYAYSGAIIPPLPSGLKRLELSALVSIPFDTLPVLPASLTYLNCENLRLRSLPSLPLSLTYLNCRIIPGWGSLAQLPVLPPLLDTLEAAGHPIKQMPALPASLKYLSCTGSDSTTAFPALPNGLKTFYFNYAPLLGTLPPFPNSIADIQCNDLIGLSGSIVLPDSLRNLVWIYSGITGFTAFPNKLENIFLRDNPSLINLPLLPASLIKLSCSGNPLISLPDLSTAVNLRQLIIRGSNLTALPEMPASLKTLICTGNLNLSSLPASVGLVDSILCSFNRLTSLPVLGSNVKVLDCSYNHLTSLPALPGSLLDLACNNNRLGELPSLPSSLKLLVALRNPSMRCLPRIPEITDHIPEILIDSSEIRCLPNTIVNGYVFAILPFQQYSYEQRFDYYHFQPYDAITLPLCNPTNNAFNCQALPIISGSVFYDINSNGTMDNGEFTKEGQKIKADNSKAATFSNKNGYFEMSARDTGHNSISLDPPLFYNVVPAAVSYNFTSFDTIVFKSYALQPNQVKDSITMTLIPLTWAARPGFGYPYIISLENFGTTVLNPSLTIHYDNIKLVYDSSNTSFTNNGNSLQISFNNFVPGEKKDAVVYFRISPAAVLGDTLVTQADISFNSANYTQEARVVIGGAFDPNDKQATPQLSPLQVSNGEFIDYTVRFQNTGTDTAFNIVITDTLHANLDAGTLELAASSHNCKATVDSNVVYFEFLNILLPDSNVNEPLSHGFVSFRIKPAPTVTVNTVISNKAAIYFDYNAPVITNTANTLIKDFTVIPLKLISFSAVPQNDNSTVLFWNTANEINTRHFVIERSNEGLYFNPLAIIAAKGRSSNHYNSAVADASTGIVFYRLKIADNNGSFVYSPVIKIDKRKNTAGVSILSNPIKDLLVISTSDRTLDHTKASIINIQGSVVKTFIVKEGGQTIDIKDLPAGIYFLKTINGSKKIFISK
jgi:uncharacterized repeat protein (TIGR01451 family)